MADGPNWPISANQPLTLKSLDASQPRSTTGQLPWRPRGNGSATRAIYPALLGTGRAPVNRIGLDRVLLEGQTVAVAAWLRSQVPVNDRG